jgi:hypothetical protein
MRNINQKQLEWLTRKAETHEYGHMELIPYFRFSLCDSCNTVYQGEYLV